MENPIFVSIICCTYNHEPYIRQCLDGFIMQKTSFRFEVLIHDDASADNTQSIIREYESKYPDIIKPIYQVENQYSKKTGILKTFQYPRVRGKYVALCEGDDYWIDPMKLQKQVDFLESNPEYSMCFHNALEHFESGKIQDRIFSKIRNADYSGPYLFKNWIVPTASVLFRRSVLCSNLFEHILASKKFMYGDTPLFCTCAALGKIRGMKDVMSVYRRHEFGLTFRKHESYDFRFAKHQEEFYHIFGRKYKSPMLISYYYSIALYRAIFERKSELCLQILKKYPYRRYILWSILFTPFMYLYYKLNARK